MPEFDRRRRFGQRGVVTIATTDSAGRQTEPWRLAYTRHAGVGPPALLIHGYLAGQAYWDLNLGALSKVCQPVVVDLWGHGDSPSPSDPGSYVPAGIVSALDHIRSVEGIDRWLVMGHSLGAALAVHYTVANPDRVVGLVVTNSNSAFPGPGWGERLRERKTLADRIDAEGMIAFDGHPLHPAQGLRLPHRARVALTEVFARHTPAGLANMLRWTTPNASTVEVLDQLRTPTLLVHGIYEKRFAPGLEVARSGIAGLEVVEVQSGHPVNVVDQVGFDRAVTQFVSRLAGTTTH